MQPAVQQSPATSEPTSHCSPGSTVPSPQTELAVWGDTWAKVVPRRISSIPTWLEFPWSWSWTKSNSNSLTLPRCALGAAVDGSEASSGSIHNHASSLPPEKSTRMTRKCRSSGSNEAGAWAVLPSASASPIRFVPESLVPWPMNRPSPREKLLLRLPLRPSSIRLTHTVPELTFPLMLREILLVEFADPLFPTRFPETVSSLLAESVYVKPGVSTLNCESPDQESFQSPVPPFSPLREPVL